MSTSHSRRKPYDGLQRKLIIAFDIGTTFSGVSYALLISGEPPIVRCVTQFPGQQKVGGDSKIPSVVCYDQQGNLVAVGSETDTNPELLEVEGLVRAERFKLHLRPSHPAAPPMPLNKTVVDIFGDILAYMYKSTKQYIKERQGQEMLVFFGGNIEYVLSHPNDWGGKQQSTMRRAAIIAGLVANESEATERITFVTEGEAGLYFCLNRIPSALENHANDGILVVDCGAETIDISAYARSSDKHFREIAPAECLLQGSCFVTHRAKEFLTEKLRHSRFGNPDNIDLMTRYFDEKTKPIFRTPSGHVLIHFGRNENDLQFDIRSGTVKIHGAQVAEFFEPAVKSIIKIIEDQLANTSTAIKAIFMVGGFATSDYLFSKLDEHFKPKRINILRPDAFLNNVVADGAVFCKLYQSVTTHDKDINPIPLTTERDDEHEEGSAETHAKSAAAREEVQGQEEEERQRRAAIAARTVRLVGARVGMPEMYNGGWIGMPEAFGSGVGLPETFGSAGPPPPPVVKKAGSAHTLAVKKKGKGKDKNGGERSKRRN